MPRRRSLLALLATPLLPGMALAQPVPTKRAVLAHYADLAQAMHGDALAGARLLQTAVARLVA